MGMPISVEVRDEAATVEIIEEVFHYFQGVDEQFSVFKKSSEISKINRGEIKFEAMSPAMQEVFRLAQETKELTNGYFDILTPAGSYNPSGLVKGWAIYQAALLLRRRGFSNFLVEAGGDIQASLPDEIQEPWRVGLRHPFNKGEIIKVLKIRNEGVATSGTYIRGQHIYNPHQPDAKLQEVVSLTVIGPNVYEADRFATAAFAMGGAGINFIASRLGLAGYQIDQNGQALFTPNFNRYLVTN